MKLVSWNVNGLRAILKKGNLLDFIAAEKPDIICLQETKMKPGQAKLDLPDYQEFWCSAERPGYSGVATFVRKNLRWPAGVTPEASAGDAGGEASENCVKQFLEGAPEAAGPAAPHFFDFSDQYGTLSKEGRLLTLDLGPCYLVNTYVPNSKPDLSRLQLRHQQWDPALRQYLQELERTKPVIVCGDFNAAHTAKDLARPKENEHNAGYTIEEREGISQLITTGFIDTFRTLHPSQIQYTWWSMRGGARIRNIGWRIDYFFISAALEGELRSATIHDEIEGSDHAPVSIEMDF